MAGAWRRWGLAAALLLAWGGSGLAAPLLIETGTRLDEVRLFRPAGTPAELVFLFSDRAGWNDSLTQAAEAMAGQGVAVLGIDLQHYRAALAASKDKNCHYLDSDIERLSKQLQQRLAMPAYRWPILAGIGAGGTLAYGAAAQAPAATIAGALAVDPSPSLATRAPLCAGAPARAAPGGGFSYGANPDLPGWLRVIDRAVPPAMPWLGQIPSAQRIAAPAGGDPASLLATLLRPMIGYGMPTGLTLDDLPLVELPATQPAQAVAVILSGDGGWRDIDMQIGQTLAAGDIGVVGLDTLRYLWSEKPPAQVARDLERIIAHYTAAWHARNVLLVGYSFGADVLPAAINRMAPEIRQQIAQVSLLGLGQEVAFEFHVGGWLGLGSADAQPIAPEAAKLDMARVQCVYGEEEDDSLCPDPMFDRAERIKTAGGHHFDGDYQALARRIVAGFAQRLRS
jgi:type IV secretory pathway VirJ component